MHSNQRNRILTLALAAGLLPALLGAAAPSKSYTGTVSDDMCGVKHTMANGGSDADCVRMCVKDGSAYALVVGDKSYTLATTDKKTLARLDSLAGKRAIVSGTLDGQTLTVQTLSGR